MTEVHLPKRILLGVCGGIAAYKSPDLVRRLIERGTDVRVVMTPSAQRFVVPLTFQAVSGNRVVTDLWDSEAEAAMGHIELARWADLVLVAPATAHFIGVLANGLADQLLGTICLATEAPIAVAPAMNRVMWDSIAVRTNCDVLRSRNVSLLGPAEGDQACGEQGAGRMLEPADIVAELSAAGGVRRQESLHGVKIVITAGPTREAIDPVRYITNRSSGKMGFAIAAAASAAGADVVLVSGPVALPTPQGVRRIDVESAEQMYRAVNDIVGDTAIFIGCAAVSDYRPAKVADEKIKRRNERMQLGLVRSPDTLASVAALEHGPFTVGFAAETTDVEAHARNKLERKGLDMIAANLVGPNCGFDKETNQLSVYWRGGHAQLDECAKPVLARRLVELVAERYRAAAATDNDDKETAA